MDDDIEVQLDQARELCHRLAGALECLKGTVAGTDSNYLIHTVVAGFKPRSASVTVDHVVRGAMDDYIRNALAWRRS